jgi:hypothetical protein
VAVKSSAKHKKILFLFWGLNRLNFLIFIAYSFRDASQEPTVIYEGAEVRRAVHPIGMASTTDDDQVDLVGGSVPRLELCAVRLPGHWTTGLIYEASVEIKNDDSKRIIEHGFTMKITQTGESDGPQTREGVEYAFYAMKMPVDIMWYSIYGEV